MGSPSPILLKLVFHIDFQGRSLSVLPRVHPDVEQGLHCQRSHFCCSGTTQQDVQGETIVMIIGMISNRNEMKIPNSFGQEG